MRARTTTTPPATTALVTTALVGVLVLTGCGSTSGGGSVDSVDCGRVTLGQGEAEVPAAALACLSEASDSGTPASLAVLAVTTEGDVITTTYTVVGVGSVRLVVDSTQDHFAGDGAGITQQTCDFGSEGGRIAVTSCTDPEPF